MSIRKPPPKEFDYTYIGPAEREMHDESLKQEFAVFDEAAQTHGWMADCGSSSEAERAKAMYDSAKAKFLALLAEQPQPAPMQVDLSHAEVCALMPAELMFGDPIQPHHVREIVSNALASRAEHAQHDAAAIRNLVLEEAARKATGFLVGDPANGIPLRSPSPHQIADAIRALQSTTPAEPVTDHIRDAKKMVPDGYVLVPVEITEAMHVAAVRTLHRCTGNDDFPRRVYRAMLEAASPTQSMKDE
jgi:hypothetical protein